jgi:hypothetical protein
LWSVATGEELQPFSGHAGFPSQVCYAADGRAVLTGGQDTTILLWDAAGVVGKAVRGALPGRAVEDLWADLAGNDGLRAHQAIWALVAEPRRSMPLLKTIQAVPEPDRRQLERWLADLDSEEFAVREEAARELEKLEEAAGPALRACLQGKPSAEVRRRVEQLLERLQEPFLTGQRLRSVRAVEALEQIGTAAARRVLEALAEGAQGARLTREAKASLGRLGLSEVVP